ncbi:MAG: bifunctional hydroxymethylpyrimidine kinase/phosphomethylpyrimidine kinase [Acidobacteriota bacterium]
MDRQPRLLTIAGSDSGGGAGIQADLKTFSAWGCYGMSVITAITAQNTVGVQASCALDPQLVEDQIDSVMDDLRADVVKIGMVANREIVEAIDRALSRHAPMPLVLDPVMVATSGDSLIDEGAQEALEALLFPRTTLLTPNLQEAEKLVGESLDSVGKVIAAGKKLGTVCSAVLIKGAHAGDSNREITDVLWNGDRAEYYRHPRIDSTNDHGTGCTLSAAIAANLGLGRSLERAVGQGIEFVERAMRNAFAHGSGRGPLNHAFLKVSPS